MRTFRTCVRVKHYKIKPVDLDLPVPLIAPMIVQPPYWSRPWWEVPPYIPPTTDVPTVWWQNPITAADRTFTIWN